MGAGYRIGPLTVKHRFSRWVPFSDRPSEKFFVRAGRLPEPREPENRIISGIAPHRFLRLASVFTPSRVEPADEFFQMEPRIFPGLCC
jgi:hypothetical protein